MEFLEMADATRKIKTRRRPASERRRRRPFNAPEQLSVTLSIPQHVMEKSSREWIVLVATKAMLLHTLYARGVCPTLATETLRVSQQHNDNKRPANPMDRKFLKLGSLLQNLLNEWTVLCSLVEVQRVLITLGPSFSRQREHHVLDFTGLTQDDTPQTLSSEACSLKQEHSLSRRLTRALLNGISEQENECHSLSHPSPASSSYMVHISVWIKREEANDLFTKSVESGNVSRNFETLLQSLILRPDFSMSASKRTQPHLVAARVSSSEKETEWNEKEGVWVTLPTSLKGFRL